MPVQSLIRAASILLTVGVAAAMGSNTTGWLTFVYGFGFSHYYLSLYYARKQVTQIVSQPTSWLPLAAVVLMGVAVAVTKFSLVVYFGFHHAFNEVYLLKQTVSEDKERLLRGLRTAGVFLHLFVYLYVLRHTTGIGSLNHDLLLAAVAVSYVAFFALLSRVSASLNRRELIDNTYLELCALALLALSFVMKLRFTHIVLFHFFSWALIPMPRMLKVGPSKWAPYLAMTAAILTPVFLFSPTGMQPYALKGSFFEQQFYFWSYFHITASFALSAAHPQWITRWFSPRPVPAVAKA